jgi:hypothetical protein
VEIAELAVRGVADEVELPGIIGDHSPFVRRDPTNLDPSHRQRVDQEFDLMIFFWQWVVGAQE